MNRPRAFAVLIAALSPVLMMMGCGHLGTHARPGQDRIVLLPDPADGTVGRAVVSNPSGSAELAAARQSTLVSPNQPPAAVTVMSEADVRRLFGEALSALPPAAQHFIVYFLFESDELTPESRALVPQILQAARDRPFPDAAVVGHTDTTGPSDINYQLGLKRANAIRALLVEAGIDAGVVEVTSHGEADPMIKTADEVYEPRNRRVEITVR